MRLQKRVFGKGRASFLRFGQAQITRRHRFDPEGFEQRTDFAHLASIVAGDDQLSGGKFSVSHAFLIP